MIKRERLSYALADVDRLLKDYFDRTNAQEGQPQLDMNWRELLKLEEHGKLVLFCERDGEKLRGFAMYVLYPHTHHAGSLWALCDIIAVDPDERGEGIGTQLIEHATRTFRVMGVDYIVQGFRTIYDVTPLPEKLGFTLVEKNYRKAL